MIHKPKIRQHYEGRKEMNRFMVNFANLLIEFKLVTHYNMRNNFFELYDGSLESMLEDDGGFNLKNLGKVAKAFSDEFDVDFGLNLYAKRDFLRTVGYSKSQSEPNSLQVITLGDKCRLLHLGGIGEQENNIKEEYCVFLYERNTQLQCTLLKSKGGLRVDVHDGSEKYHKVRLADPFMRGKCAIFVRQNSK